MPNSKDQHEPAKPEIRHRQLSLKYIRAREKKFWEELSEDDISITQLEGNMGIAFGFRKQRPRQYK